MFGKRVTSVESEQRIVSRLLCHYVAGIKRSDLTAGGWRNEGDRPGLPPLGRNRAKMHAHRSRITRITSGQHAIRESSSGPHGRNLDTLPPPPPSSEIQGFSRYCCPLFNVNPAIIIAALCYPPSLLEASVAWQFRRG